MTQDALTGWVEVTADAVERARAACDELRWHEAYRRRWREVRAEAGLRAAHASAALEGARLPLDLVRSLATGTTSWPAAGAAPRPADDGAGPTVARGGSAAGVPAVDAEAVLVGALRGASLVESLVPDLGSQQRAALPPLPQLLARAHTVVGAGWLPVDALGRLRTDEPALDQRGLGPAPTGREVAARIDLLARTVATTNAPALVVAALVHAEVLAVRPFVAGNGLVARLVARVLATSGGLDPTGSVLPELTWADAPQPYVAGVAGYSTGEPERVAAWFTSYASAVVAGAAAARTVADAVLAGSLS
ncbi:Fic family protein [Cellulomonas persica]|uniref:Fic family protein n=1 Tax=Cellulomonas persica TaxID=76861 RepID=UPI001FF04258|nr:Fic family protein [Cellulomonas persica]